MIIATISNLVDEDATEVVSELDAFVVSAPLTTMELIEEVNLASHLKISLIQG